jgi:hypothetical protein
MLHVPPLPGAPRFAGELSAIRTHVLDDARALLDGGIDGLILENFGDAPFYPTRVPAYVVAHMTRLAWEVRQRCSVPLGVNVLRNDGLGALAVAHAAGAEFIRVNVLCGARVTDQGIVEGIAHQLVRERTLLRAESIRILADVNVKHSAPLGRPRPTGEEVADLVLRGGADALIVTGGATGQSAAPAELREVAEAAGETPVFVGSGVTPDTIADWLNAANGVIVGTAVRYNGVVANPVDPARVQALIHAAHAGRRK